jgi:F-type H+-transporting ATPase subunit delta
LASEATGVTPLAERYAVALFDIADERRTLDAVAADLRQLRTMLSESPDLGRLIRSPILSRDVQGRAIAAVAEAAELSRLVRDFLAVVARNRRLFAVPAMIAAYLAKLAARRGEITAEVTAAQPLTLRSNSTPSAKSCGGAPVGASPSMCGSIRGYWAALSSSSARVLSTHR